MSIFSVSIFFSLFSFQLFNTKVGNPKAMPRHKKKSLFWSRFKKHMKIEKEKCSATPRRPLLGLFRPVFLNLTQSWLNHEPLGGLALTTTFGTEAKGCFKASQDLRNRAQVIF